MFQQTTLGTFGSVRMSGTSFLKGGESVTGRNDPEKLELKAVQSPHPVSSSMHVGDRSIGVCMSLHALFGICVSCMPIYGNQEVVIR